jgi:uncharacterized protein YjbI with pentapeptide repeats
MTIDPMNGNTALDVSFDPETDTVPNHFLNAVNFTETTFVGEVNAAGAEFSNLIFFERARFQDTVDFSGAVFHHNVVFRETRFQGEARFDRATFHRAAQFVRAEFQGKATFAHTVFFENAFFTEARFSEGVSMTDAHFGRILYAPLSIFENDAYFDRSCFCLAVVMKDAVFDGVLSMKSALGNVMSLAGARVRGPVQIVDTPFAVLDVTDARCEGDVMLFGRQWEEGIDEIRGVVSEGVKEEPRGGTDGDGGCGGFAARMEWAKKRRDETESLAEMHRERGRIVDLVGLEGVRVLGRFRADFSYLAPLSREFPVLDSHRRALKNRDPEGSEGNRAAWHRAEREYAWLADQYHRQDMADDEEAARLWEVECRIRGLSGFKKKMFDIYRQDQKRRKKRKEKKDP